MPAENTLHAFFDQADALNRILFLYGGTDDAYFTKGALQNSMEYMLEEHLTQCGYDVVMFYNGVQGLYCFTRANAEKRDQYFRTDAPGNDEVDDAMADLFGTEEEPQDDNSRAASLRVEISDLEIASFADKVMRSTQVRSALVFSDGWDFLENTAPDAQRTLANRLRSWYHIGSQNRNICILCFSKLNRSHLEDCIRRSPCWGFLEEKIFNGNGFSNAVKYISIPDRDEIYELLRFQPEFRRLRQESERKRVLTAAQQQLHTMGNSLKGLAYFLDNTPNPIQVLLDGMEDDSRVLETLHNTKGWEPVAQAIDRMAEVVARSERKAPPEPHPGTLLRMNEGDRGFVPAGVTLNMILEGPPGTGKTTVAKLLGRIYRKMGLLPSGHVVECARDDLVGQYIGHTAVKTRAAIEKAMGGILFVDEAYTLYRGGRSQGNADFGQEALDTLVEAMTRNVGSFAVVLAGYPDEMETLLSANPGLRSRFGQNIVHMQDYPPPLLQSIALKYLSSQYASTGLTFDPVLLRPGTTGNKPLDVFFQGWFDARDRKSFGNARDVRNLVDGLVHQALYRKGNTILKEDFPPHLQDYFKESDLDLDSVLASLSEIVGLQEVKNKLISIVRRLRMYNLQKAARPERMKNKIAPGHYLFCGNPGTGKSTISVKFAQILGALRIAGRFEPIRVTGTMLYETLEKKGVEGVREVIQGALGGVLFIDEAHQLIQTPFILQLLLDPMIENRSELCVILACYTDQVDAIFRAEPGLRSRLSGIFHFEDYTAEELTQIFVHKITEAGYTLGEGGREGALAWMKNRLDTDKVSHNGRYAETLFAQAQDRMAERLADCVSDGTIREEDLFTILPGDLAEEPAETESGNSV